jgi:hypothetical protein
MSPRALGVVASFVVGVLGVALAHAQPGAPLPPPPAPKPEDAVELDSLPTWPGHVARGKVLVHAADVDGEALRSALADAGAAWLVTPADTQVTGRVAVKTRAAAMTALAAFEPALAVTRPRLRGGGPNVDLDFHGAPTDDLFRLLADVQRINVVSLAPPQKVTVRVKRTPAGAVLAETVRVAGLAMDKPAPNIIVIRPATSPAIDKLDRPGLSSLAAAGARRRTPALPPLTLAARQIHAAHLLALVTALDPPAPPDLSKPLVAFCDGGDKVDLRLSKVKTAHARALIAIAGDVRVGGDCYLPPLAAGADPRKMTLLATVTRGDRKLAAVEHAGKVAFIDDADAGWTVGRDWIAYEDARGNVTTPLYPTAFVPPPVLPPGNRAPRLAATIIDARVRRAVVEIDGAFQVWEQGRLVHLGDDVLMIEIEPGALRVIGRLDSRFPDLWLQRAK